MCTGNLRLKMDCLLKSSPLPLLFPFFLFAQPLHPLSNLCCCRPSLRIHELFSHPLISCFHILLDSFSLYSSCFSFHFFLFQLISLSFAPSYLECPSLFHCTAAPLWCLSQFSSFLGVRCELRPPDQILAADDCFDPTFSCPASA